VTKEKQYVVIRKDVAGINRVSQHSASDLEMLLNCVDLCRPLSTSSSFIDTKFYTSIPPKNDINLWSDDTILILEVAAVVVPQQKWTLNGEDA